MTVGVARAQEPAAPSAGTAKAAPAATVVPPDNLPLARYVPGEHLALLIEHDGLDNHAEGWAKTAAFKMLNETKLGAMLEAMTAQLADRVLASYPNRKLNGADVATIIKHAAMRGVVVGGGILPNAGNKGHTVIVFRGATAKDVRGPFSRMVGSFMGASKPQLGKKGSRTVVVVPAAEKGGQSWSWWSEGNDLVIESGEAALAGDVLDGKLKSAVDHPIRQALTQGDGAFQPVGRILLDVQALPGTGLAGSPLASLKGVGLDRIEWRYGVDNDAITSVVKLAAPSPRKGLMALFDQPTFDTSKVPPLPEGLGSFVAISLDADKAVEPSFELAPRRRQGDHRSTGRDTQEQVAR
ncbi:MAG: hypothetical protein U0794_02370 [Isosphaeraceae bacterium]